MLKAGMLFKMISENTNLAVAGFTLGGFYQSVDSAFGGGAIDLISPKGFRIKLVDRNGELTDNADYFAEHKCPVILPRGQV